MAQMHFWEGPAGVGKTSRAIRHLDSWLQNGVPPDQIVVLVPQRALGQPYQQFLSQLNFPNALGVQVVTFNGLAQRALTLFWGEVAPQLMPDWDGRDPTYLTIETAQYYMAQFLDPLYEQGRFDSISLDRSRLVAQILNNLSAAAVNDFSLDETEKRLMASWMGASSRLGVYQAAMQVARAFRQHCQAQALLDFSLQVETFNRFLLNHPPYEAYARQQYRYLIVDNLEENYPVSVDFINWLWDSLDEGVLIYDRDAGYRLFLGADRDIAYEMREDCQQRERADDSLVQTAALANLTAAFSQISLLDEVQLPPLDPPPTQAFELQFRPFYPQMLDWVAEKVRALIQEEGVSPGEIVILAPFLGDALRFNLMTAFERAGIPYLSHRPSRALRDEPVARAALNLMKCLYPPSEDLALDPLPSRTDFAMLLAQFIAELDPIRADLLAQGVYQPPDKVFLPFDELSPKQQARISYRLGEKYEGLRLWYEGLKTAPLLPPPDHFLRALFDLVTQVGYGFHVNLEAGRVIAQLIESAAHFRGVVGDLPAHDLAWQYIGLVGDGVLAALPSNPGQQAAEEAVFIAPAYTFLMRNRWADYQFWVDIGSQAWFERIEQPVTHPYILRRAYPAGIPWTDEAEFAAQTDMLKRLLLGLTRRCRQKLFLAGADLGESGYEQRGVLLKIFNQIVSVYGQESS
jgi:hypothetical protein